MDLDSVELFGTLDRSDMLGHIFNLPQQCEAGWELARRLDLPASYREVKQVLVLGMGGSAMGGVLVQGLVSQECAIPITVVRDYVLPAHVQGPDCLVVACSYSGNTEETLFALDDALGRGVRLAALTTGGRLAAWAEGKGLPLARFEYLSQPRAALGYSFILLLGLLWQAGLLRDWSDELAEATRTMREWQAEIGPHVPAARNPAKSLASQLSGYLPVVYGAGHMAPVANRWKTQFNENSKQWAFSEALPELHHNSVVGFSNPLVMREHTHVVMLRSGLDHPRVQVRWDVTPQLLEHEGVASTTLVARGASRLAQQLSLIHFGDYVSFYLAMLNDVDPTPIGAISFLKQRLAEAG